MMKRKEKEMALINVGAIIGELCTVYDINPAVKDKMKKTAYRALYTWELEFSDSDTPYETYITNIINKKFHLKRRNVMSCDLKKEYSDRFDTLRKNRVEASYYKYGPAKTNFGDKLVNAVGSHNMCVQKYEETGNTEYLLDAANYLMFEFMYPQHENAHFKATDSDESAGTSGEPIGKWGLPDEN